METPDPHAPRIARKLPGIVVFACLAAWLSLSGCSPEMDGEMGSSIFAIENNSADTVVGIFRTRESQPAPDTTPGIPPGSTLDFLEDSDFGRVPEPSQSLLSLEILRKRDARVLARQDPVVDSLWTPVTIDSTLPGSVRFTIRVSGP